MRRRLQGAGPTEQESLCVVDSELSEQRQSGRVLDALGDRLLADAARFGEREGLFERPLVDEADAAGPLRAASSAPGASMVPSMERTRRSSSCIRTSPLASVTIGWANIASRPSRRAA